MLKKIEQTLCIHNWKKGCHVIWSEYLYTCTKCGKQKVFDKNKR